MKLLAVDPGKTIGFVLFVGGEPRLMGELSDYRKLSQDTDLVYMLDAVCIETIVPYSQQLQQDVINTCMQIGGIADRFRQQQIPVYMVTRPEVKRHLFGKQSGTDAEVRRAVLERLGEVGTKKTPGPCYGMKGHMFAAAAVGILAIDQLAGDRGEGKKFAAAFDPTTTGNFATSGIAGENL